MKILLTGAFSALNKGDEARVKCTVKMLSDVIPDAIFGFWSTQPMIDARVYDDLGIKIEPRYKYAGKFKNRHLCALAKIFEMFWDLFFVIIWRLLGKSRNQILRSEFVNYKMFVDVSGESLTSYYGYINLLRCLYPIYIGILLKKPIVIFAQTIGPFDGSIQKIIASKILNQVDLITVRDQSSFSYLRKYGISKPTIKQTADPAFILEPVRGNKLQSILKIEKIYRNRKLILGMTISRGSYRHSILAKDDIDRIVDKSYYHIAKFVDYVVETLDVKLVFFPHALQGSEDDRRVLDNIIGYLNNKDKILMISGDYSSAVIKGLISNCDLFIGSRMHANIAALSSNVPTIGIAYSHKMHGLFELLGQDDYVLNIEDIRFDRLNQKFHDLYCNRLIIRHHLEVALEEIRHKSLLNADLVNEIVMHRGLN